MSDELFFNNELRKCLNAAGLSDCGENDQRNYWYQRVHKAHDQAVDGVTEAQRAENAKLRDEFRKMDEWHSKELFAAIDENKRLRELVRHLRECTKHNTCALCDYAEDACDFDYDMRELGVDE